MLLKRSAALTSLSLLALLLLTACAPFAPKPLTMPRDLNDVQTMTVGDVTVSISILTDEQSRRHFGADLAAHQVQAVWMSVRNASPRKLWFIRNALDPDFYSADEVALMIRRQVSGEKLDTVRQYLRDESIRVLIQSTSITEGCIFLPKVEGGRYLEVTLYQDNWDEAAAAQTLEPKSSSADDSASGELRFGFAVRLPDGHFDYERLDPAKIYGDATLPELNADALRAELESLTCCASNADGSAQGDPLNLVLIGDAPMLLRALSRSGWSFTHRITPVTVVRMIGAALNGTPYPIAPISNLYALGRVHDVALQRARLQLDQRNHLRLWLAPFTFEGQQVWIGQVSRDIGIKLTPKSPTLTTHIIDPEVDTTREYLLHSLLGHGLVNRFGFVKGSAQAPRTAPRVNLTDDPFFSDGMRLVVVLSPEPVAAHKARNLRWEQSASPIAEGQSDAASRNVRSIVLLPGP